MGKSDATAILVVAVDGFGRGVARWLGHVRDNVRTVNGDGSSSIKWGAESVLVGTSMTLMANELDSLAEHARARQKLFVPVVLDGRGLYVGPVCAPDGGACWRCWITRYLQHTVDRIGPNELVGRPGYLPLTAMMAASLVSNSVDRHVAGNASGGLWHVDIVSRRVSSSKVVGVHGCPICGLKRDPQTRSVVEIRRAFENLWQS